jgi:phosphoenolpyruvate---glycerone phosphotransferase subunit DhaL
MTDLIGRAELGDMFAQAAACIRSEHQRLTELDSIGGDGDHGTTMLRAAEQIERGIEESRTASLTDLLKAVGWKVLGVDGGASSALLGTFFAGMGDVELSQDAMNCHDLARSFQAGLRAMSRQTKAGPGDKTMMDALVPAVAAVTAAAAAGKSISDALDDAALAAQLGAESTRDLVARHGRARSLGERTRGHPDAGATSIALLFRGFSAGLKRELSNG